MKLYHVTNEYGWSQIQKSGYLLSKNGDIYFHPIATVAKSFGDIVIEFEVDDNILNELIKTDKNRLH